MNDPHQIAAEAAHGHLRWTDEEMTEIIQSVIEKALNNQGDDYANMDAARNRILDLERDLAACRRAADTQRLDWIEANHHRYVTGNLPITRKTIDAAMKSQPVHASETETPEYQEFLSECAKHCRCTMTICESVLAGGLCEERIESHD